MHYDPKKAFHVKHEDLSTDFPTEETESTADFLGQARPKVGTFCVPPKKGGFHGEINHRSRKNLKKKTWENDDLTWFNMI